ncbi:MAG: YdeI/OmpD-associated family protein [Cyclobacteriaceae bacterium]|nr:YdeI/OmpD-associated family protein [Cyclobacteriaceae bacterium]
MIVTAMLRFATKIQRFDKKGEKTGWHFIEVSAAQAKKLKDGKPPRGRQAFRVRGTIDSLAIQKMALIPMGGGDFILPLNATLRKAIGKKHGDKITLNLEVDERKLILSPDLISCLKEDPSALQFFKSLPPSHQQYYSKWIESAKTTATKTKRIVISIEAFGKKQGYAEMMRAYKNRID